MLLKENLTQASTGQRITAKGYAVAHKSDTFKPFSFSRHAWEKLTFLIEILYAGICHSDIHSAREEWHKGIFPMVPGTRDCG